MTDIVSRIASGLGKSAQPYRISVPATAAILLGPFAIMFFALLVLALSKPFHRWITEEGRPVELLTFVGLLVAGILSLRLAFKVRRSEGTLVTLFYAVFAVGLLFVAMEEVSWGQLLFGFEAPEAMQDANKKAELNLHNMPAFHSPFEILRFAFGLGGLVGVWLSFKPRTRSVGAPAVLAPCFAVIAVVAGLDALSYYLPDSGNKIFYYTGSLVEYLEMLVSFSALLYVGLNGRMLAGTGDEEASPSSPRPQGSSSS